MMYSQLDRIKIFNRPVKPLAFFTMMLMLTYVVFHLRNSSMVLNYSVIGHAMSIIAGISVFCFFYGWFYRNQKMAEVGLLISAFVYITSALNALLLDGIVSELFWGGFWAAGLVGSAFYLEVRDRLSGNLDKNTILPETSE